MSARADGAGLGGDRAPRSVEDPDAQQVLLLGRRCQRNHSFAKASPHQVRERNCLEAGLTFSHLPLTPHPTEREKNLLLEGKSRVPPSSSSSSVDLSGL